MSDAPISSQQQEREDTLTEKVVRSFDGAKEERLRFLLQALVTHLHGYVRAVRLTEEEWSAAINFLTAVGHITDERRQEFVLLSDVLGVSMQTITVNNEAYRNATEATVFGPFFTDDAPLIELGGDISGGASGEPCWVHGTVKDVDGNPIPHATIEVWEADDEGLYDVQRPEGSTYGRARLYSDERGEFRFWALTPTPYPIPSDGPVGKLLEATGRSPYRASHLHFMVSAPGWRTLVTHIFVRGDDLLANDSVFGVKESLIKDFAIHPGTQATPDGRELGGRRWSDVRFDIVLPPATIR